jgi:predicted cupin superfamily sugar epimerase
MVHSTAEQAPNLHRIRADEQWHFYTGSPLTIHIIQPDSRYTPKTLGIDLNLGQTLQAVVPHGCWFGATVQEPDSFALVGCCVAPGFEFADFELAERNKLTAKFPEHSALIARLTRD